MNFRWMMTFCEFAKPNVLRVSVLRMWKRCFFPPSCMMPHFYSTHVSTLSARNFLTFRFIWPRPCWRYCQGWQAALAGYCAVGS
jgi:hypothetical protein